MPLDEHLGLTPAGGIVDVHDGQTCSAIGGLDDKCGSLGIECSDGVAVLLPGRNAGVGRTRIERRDAARVTAAFGIPELISGPTRWVQTKPRRRPQPAGTAGRTAARSGVRLATDRDPYSSNEVPTPAHAARPGHLLAHNHRVGVCAATPKLPVGRWPGTRGRRTFRASSRRSSLRPAATARRHPECPGRTPPTREQISLDSHLRRPLPCRRELRREVPRTMRKSTRVRPFQLSRRQTTLA